VCKFRLRFKQSPTLHFEKLIRMIDLLISPEYLFLPSLFTVSRWPTLSNRKSSETREADLLETLVDGQLLDLEDFGIFVDT
jgi:hypothetical protein